VAVFKIGAIGFWTSWKHRSHHQNGT